MEGGWEGAVGTAGVSTADSARSPAHRTRGSRSPTGTQQSPTTAPIAQQGGSLMASPKERTHSLTDVRLLLEGTTILSGCLKLIAYFSPLFQSCQGPPVLLLAVGTASQHHRAAGQPASNEPFHCWREFCSKKLAQHPDCDQTSVLHSLC